MDNAQSTKKDAKGILNTKRVRALMAEKGMTQRDLALASGVTEVAISRYMCGHRSPRFQSALAIAEALGTTVDSIVRDEWQEVDMADGEGTIRVILDDGAFLPERAHRPDAGMDLRSPIAATIQPLGSEVIDTGVHAEIPEGCAGVLVSKSGLNVKHDITSTGLIDEGYTGSIRVKLYNHGRDPYTVNRGDKISQLVIIPVRRPGTKIVSQFDGETERGDAGFGSSGR